MDNKRYTVADVLKHKRKMLKKSRYDIQRALELQGYEISIYKIKRLESDSSEFINMKDVLALSQVLQISYVEICSCSDFLYSSKRSH